MEKGQDIRDLIFRKVERKKYLAHIFAQGEGIFSGVGWVSKASGIATAAWKARKTVGMNQKVISGAWKKVSAEIVDIGQAIIDAPLLDMRLDITAKL